MKGRTEEVEDLVGRSVEERANVPHPLPVLAAAATATTTTTTRMIAVNYPHLRL